MVVLQHENAEVNFCIVFRLKDTFWSYLDEKQNSLENLVKYPLKQSLSIKNLKVIINHCLTIVVFFFKLL